jgi:hypothetical protein
VDGTHAGTLAAQTPLGDYDGDCRERGMTAELNGMLEAGLPVTATVEQTLVDKVVTRTRLLSHSARIQPCVPESGGVTHTPSAASDSQPTVP